MVVGAGGNHHDLKEDEEEKGREKQRKERPASRMKRYGPSLMVGAFA